MEVDDQAVTATIDVIDIKDADRFIPFISSIKNCSVDSVFDVSIIPLGLYECNGWKEKRRLLRRMCTAVACFEDAPKLLQDIKEEGSVRAVYILFTDEEHFKRAYRDVKLWSSGSFLCITENIARAVDKDEGIRIVYPPEIYPRPRTVRRYFQITPEFKTYRGDLILASLEQLEECAGEIDLVVGAMLANLIKGRSLSAIWTMASKALSSRKKCPVCLVPKLKGKVCNNRHFVCKDCYRQLIRNGMNGCPLCSSSYEQERLDAREDVLSQDPFSAAVLAVAMWCIRDACESYAKEEEGPDDLLRAYDWSSYRSEEQQRHPCVLVLPYIKTQPPIPDDVSIFRILIFVKIEPKNIRTIPVLSPMLRARRVLMKYAAKSYSGDNDEDDGGIVYK